MAKHHDSATTGRPRFPTVQQISAGGIAVRSRGNEFEMTIVSAGTPHRWQLPKGIVEQGESLEQTAMREVREEAGIETDLVGAIDTVEYWYVGNHRGQRVRFHKFVHFFLLTYRSGDVRDHDHEVHEVEWVSMPEAIKRLTFESERSLVKKAITMLAKSLS